MAKKDTAIIPVKIPFAETQKKLAEFMEYLEITAGEIPDDLIPSLDAVEINSRAAADRRIFLIDALDVQINHFDEMIKDIKLRQTKLIKAQDNIYKKTLDIMRENNIREIHGSIKSFKIRNKGGVEAINWLVDFNEVKNVVSENEETLIPKEFIEEKTIKIINKKALSEAIRKGDDMLCGTKAGREEVLAIV
ncbi:hypothetical protein GCL60_16700 [Silvanigrella paludirubra]|uniref:Siphovirus Gp157 family protein n=1 Tax=Silvanigrella paludirubra TaxID=2499159 RepID=A0A6N6VSU4_9BACT|nr:siphovirus Gp157 family protein [Silvanigrella paludirubra]KAB8035869.1 hypothetical protein GCL60_16700 [Silvanigrella paludirubra]